MAGYAFGLRVAAHALLAAAQQTDAAEGHHALTLEAASGAAAKPAGVDTAWIGFDLTPSQTQAMTWQAARAGRAVSTFLVATVRIEGCPAFDPVGIGARAGRAWGTRVLRECRRVEWATRPSLGTTGGRRAILRTICAEIVHEAIPHRTLAAPTISFPAAPDGDVWVGLLHTADDGPPIRAAIAIWVAAHGAAWHIRHFRRGPRPDYHGEHVSPITLRQVRAGTLALAAQLSACLAAVEADYGPFLGTWRTCWAERSCAPPARRTSRASPRRTPRAGSLGALGWRGMGTPCCYSTAPVQSPRPGSPLSASPERCAPPTPLCGFASGRATAT